MCSTASSWCSRAASISPRGRLADAQRRRRRGDQRVVADRTSGLERAAPHVKRLLGVELVEAVDRELDLKSGRRGGRAVGHLLPRANEAAMRLFVAAHPVLDRRAERRQLDPLGDGLRRKQLHRLEQGGPAALELPSDRSAEAKRHAHGHLALRVCAGKQAHGGAEPARGRAGRARAADACPASSSSPMASSSPWPRRLLDVVGPLGRIGAPGGQRFGCAGMAGKPPATAHRFVDRAPHERDGGR